MLPWFHRRLKPIARGLLAVVASLWLVAAAVPCAMAQPLPSDPASVPCSMDKSMAPADMKDCGPAMTMKCKLPEINSPIAAALSDHAVTPILLTVLPVSLTLSGTGERLPRDFFTPDIPAPPLYIRHLTLLI